MVERLYSSIAHAIGFRHHHHNHRDQFGRITRVASEHNFQQQQPPPTLIVTASPTSSTTDPSPPSPTCSSHQHHYQRHRRQRRPSPSHHELSSSTAYSDACTTPDPVSHPESGSGLTSTTPESPPQTVGRRRTLDCAVGLRVVDRVRDPLLSPSSLTEEVVADPSHAKFSLRDRLRRLSSQGMRSAGGGFRFPKSTSKQNLQVPGGGHEPLGRTRSTNVEQTNNNKTLDGAALSHDPLHATHSSPSDIKRRTSRRSVKREQYYGSVEAINSSGPVRNTHRFRLEPGTEAAESTNPLQGTVMVENPQSEIRWYWKYFLGQLHQNLAGIDPVSKSPFFISVLVEDEPNSTKLCRSIVWQHVGPKRMCIPYTRPLTVKAVLQKYPGMSDFNRGLREIHNAKIQKDLIVLEDQEGGINCKFGVIFAKSGQTSDVEMLGNESGDGYFESFLGILGQRIQLNGWGNYKGGLDTITNSTGRESVYTTFASHEIMFHVSTLLPHSADNVQQVERKRHIGNDIVNVVFEDAVDPRQPTFSPTMMKSHFTHVFAVVTVDKELGCYRLWVYSEKSVPAYGPPLPFPNEFYDPKAFREFLLTKVINGEKAALQAKAFVEKRQKTNDTLINDMYLEYLKDCPKGLAQMIIEPMVKHGPVKDDYGEEFVKYGALIKLEKTLSGDVAYYSPKKLSLCRKQPWEPQLLFSGAPYFDKILSSDSWGELAVLTVNSAHEVHYVESSLCTQVIEPAAEIHQLCALEEFGLFIARLDSVDNAADVSGKDSGVCVFPLSDLKSAIRQNTLISRQTCQNYRINGTKGCHLFSTTDPFGLRLSLVVAIGKRMLLFRWAFGPLGPIEEGTDVTRNWTLVNEVTAVEEPTVMSTFEVGPLGAVRLAMVGKSLHVLDLSTGADRQIPSPSVPKSKCQRITAVADGNDEEILYTYDNITNTVLSVEPSDQPPPIFWTSNTKDVVYRFPFVIGFSHDQLEVRLAINGNLLSSIYMPGVRLLATKHDVMFAAERTVEAADKKESTDGRRTLDVKPSTNERSTSGVTRTVQLASMCTSAASSSSPGGSFSGATTCPPGTTATGNHQPAAKFYDIYSIPARNLQHQSGNKSGGGGFYFAGYRSPMRATGGMLASRPTHNTLGDPLRKPSNTSRDDSFDIPLPPPSSASTVVDRIPGAVGKLPPKLPPSNVVTKTVLYNKTSSDSGVGRSCPQSFEASSLPDGDPAAPPGTGIHAASSPIELKEGDTLL